MDNIIPLIQFTFDENNPNAGMIGISLVDKPAIESQFQYFNRSTPIKSLEYFAVEGYEGVVQGLALKPDMPILRYDMNNQPYFGYFTKETVKKLRDSFQKNLRTNNVSVDHNGKSVDGYLMESFIIDSESRLADVKSRGIEDATMGSWFVQYKIEDKEVFDRVIKGELQGFSIEGFLQTFLSVTTNNNFNKSNTNKMKQFIEKFQALLDEMKSDKVEKFEVAKIYDGVDSIEWSEIGQPVNIILPDGSKKLAGEGAYITDNEKEIVVDAAGNLVEIRSVEKEIEDDNADGVNQPEPAVDSSTDEEMKKVVEEYETKVSQFSVQVKELETTNQNLKSQIVNLEKEIETLKKAPLADPIVNPAPVKVALSKAELAKLTPMQKIAYQKGIELPKKFAVKN